MEKYWNLLIAVGVAMGAGLVLGEGTATIDGRTLTLDGLVTNVTAEAELGAVDSVVMHNGGGVAFARSLAAGKTYAIAGDGLAATGVVSVAAGQTVGVSGAALLANGTLGHVLVKRGAGKLTLTYGPGPVETPTRWIVEEGVFSQAGASFFGNHRLTTTNLTLDVREGATWRIDDGEHCPMGTLELTGGRLEMPGKTRTADWGNTAFRGGVVAHACATPSTIDIGGNAHLNHVYADVPFTVELGAVLNVYGCLANGWNEAASARINNRLIVSGGGELRLLGSNLYTGGTVLRDGTTLTLANAEALGTGGLEIEGNVTLAVPGGVTVVAPRVTGSGTLTKTGAGVATFTSVDAGVTVTRAEGEGVSGETVQDGVLFVNGHSVTVDVPAGETLTVTEIREGVVGCGLYTEVVKTGDGILELPNVDSTLKIKSLTVKGGLVAGADTKNFGAAIVLAFGGGLRPTASFQLGVPLTVSGSGRLDLPSGVTFKASSNLFHTANATLTKTGAGTLAPTGEYRSLGVVTGARWIIDAGELLLVESSFSNHAGMTELDLEIHEGAVLRSTTHNPLGRVTLRGGTLTSQNFSCLATGGGTWELERNARWYPFSFNGTITVLPSADGRPSRISVPQAVCLGHADHWAVFDVKDGATLEVDALLQPGENSAATAVKASDFVKRGGGNLVLLKNCGLQGQISIDEGTVTLGPDARFAPEAKMSVAPGAKVVLPDGSLLASDVDATAGVLASADVWLDASRLVAVNGSTISSVPNYGTAHGAFLPSTKTGSFNGKNFVAPGKPTYVANGINGLGCLAFNGAQALTLTSWTNRTQNIEVFFVGEWTYWENAGGKGQWGAPISFGSIDMTADDNHSKPSFAFQHSGTVGTVYIYNQDVANSFKCEQIAVGTPYFKHAYHLGGNMEMDIFVDDDHVAVTGTTTRTAASLDVDVVAVGGRLTSGGMLQTVSTALTDVSGIGKLALDGNNRMFVGRIGELLAFSRALTDGERAVVGAYLKAKWLGSSVRAESVESTGTAPSALRVEVPADARAAIAGTVTTGLARGSTTLAKEGEGVLDVAVRLQSDGALTVVDGGVAFGRSIPSRADVWFDATDADTIVDDGNGKIVSVANKGRAGGAFVQATGWNNVGPVPLPTLAQDGIGGLPAVAFDGNSALILNAYTNRNSARSLHVYAVLRRTSFTATGGKGQWAGPFSFNSIAARAEGTAHNDNHVTGSFHYEETSATGGAVYTGNQNYMYDRKCDSTGEDLLFVCHQCSAGTTFAFENATNAVTAIPQWSQGVQKPIDVDVVLLGGRTAINGTVQWTAMNNSGNRMWYGNIGELIAFSQPLGYTEECALLAYLRRKWLGKGEGATTPPAFLSGDWGLADLTPAALELADGTGVEQAGPTLELASLETGANVAFVRDWAGEAAGFALFDVAGEISVGSSPMLAVVTAPTQTAKLIGGTPVGTLPTWTVTGDKAKTCRVVGKGDGLYLSVANGTVLYLR